MIDVQTFLEWYNLIPEYIKDEIDNYNREKNENEITISLTINDKIYQVNCILKKLQNLITCVIKNQQLKS